MIDNKAIIEEYNILPNGQLTYSNPFEPAITNAIINISQNLCLPISMLPKYLFNIVIFNDFAYLFCPLSYLFLTP